jgi:hypothetical protein
MSAFAPLAIVVLLSAPSALPFLSLSAISTTPIADARAAGLDRWLPEATGGVWRILATDAEIDAIEADPACIVWGAVAELAAVEVAS